MPFTSSKRGSSGSKVTRCLSPALALVDNERRSASAVADTKVALLKWSKENFHDTLRRSPEAALGILRVLSAKLREDVAVQVITARQLQQANEQLERENRSLRVRLSPTPEMVTDSPRMEQVIELARKVADTSSTVLLRGESGTGKEVLAHLIHRHSDYRDGPFIPVHCAALPRDLLESELFGHEKGAFTGATARRVGRFELADGGTLFLDEIGELDQDIQVKLLRVLQSQEFERIGGSKTISVNVRLISATNRNLEEAVASGGFREDLYYRLNVIPILLPPLRERREDIPLLVEHFLAQYSKELARPACRASAQAMDMLASYSWPGNVRELQNLVERMVVVVDDEIIGPLHLPPEMQGLRNPITDPVPAGMEPLAEVEERHVRAALIRCGWNQSRAARLLEISREQLRHRIKQYQIEGPWKVGAPERN